MVSYREILRSPRWRAGADLTVLLPVYNEAECLEQVLTDYYATISSNLSVELVVVEDGSTDDTKEILKRLLVELPLILDMGESRRGYSHAILEGLSYSSAKYVLFADSDGQHYPEDFWRLWEVRGDADIVSGARTPRADPPHRRAMSWAFTFVARSLFPIPRYCDLTAPLRLVRRPVALTIASEFRHMRESFWTEFTLRAAAKRYTITEVPVRHRAAFRKQQTHVYTATKLPSIVARQLYGLWALRKELIEATKD